MKAAATARMTSSPLRLLVAAVGGRRAVAGKLRRVAQTARIWLDAGEVDRRLH